MTKIVRKKGAGPRALLVLAPALALAACEEEGVDSLAFPDIAACQDYASQAEGFDAGVCDDAFAAAQAEHEITAPRYTDQALCEQEHGAENCVAEAAPGGGGSVFLPLLAGYMIGRTLGGGFGARPLVGAGGGGFATPDGRTQLAGNRGSFRGAPAAFQAPAQTARAAPLTRADVAQRGGFGAARTSSRGLGGGFGG